MINPMGPALSGLKTFEKKMRVTANNVANINTCGFKASKASSQDVLNETITTSAGPSQVGRGTAMADISSSFSQGSFESTDSSTDLAIGGKGFLVETPDDIRPALEAAFASGKTCCINVMTDPTTVSPGSMALANVGAYKA